MSWYSYSTYSKYSSSSGSSEEEEDEMISLENGLVSTQKGLGLLIKNDYQAALETFRELSDESLYHSHFYSLIQWLKAYLSLELVCFPFFLYFYHNFQILFLV